MSTGRHFRLDEDRGRGGNKRSEPRDRGKSRGSRLIGRRWGDLQAWPTKKEGVVGLCRWSVGRLIVRTSDHRARGMPARQELTQTIGSQCFKCKSVGLLSRISGVGLVSKFVTREHILKLSRAAIRQFAVFFDRRSRILLIYYRFEHSRLITQTTHRCIAFVYRELRIAF